MIDFKLVGSTLLITGTSIGAGMLALPIVTAQLGFPVAILLLLLCWLIMTTGAFLLLEANLWLPQNSNLVSMAKVTIGPWGQMIAWVAYLLLLYSLLCAYIAGGSDLLHNLLLKAGVDLPSWFSATLFTLVFGTIVYLGIRAVDYTNRCFLSVKLAAYGILVALLFPFINTPLLSVGFIEKITTPGAIAITIVSFGYATIVPSLRVYFAGDIKKLKIAILLGSLIPFFCYLFWDAVIMGIIPLHGAHGLLEIMQAKTSISDLVNTLNSYAHRNDTIFFVKLFTSICVITSFLGVALCLADFLSDGFQLEKVGFKNKIIIHLATFVPPFVIALFFPNAFIKALEYGGLYCIILLMFLPAWMVWCGRYRRHINKGFRVPGGRILLTTLLLLSLWLIFWGAW